MASPHTPPRPRLRSLVAGLPLGMAAAYLLTIVGANWALDRFGIVPVGFGLMAPAGVWFAGLAFGLRDALHEAGGRAPVMAAILAGGALSYFIEPAFAVASAVAFLVSELADLAVYDPLRQRNWPVAVAASNAVGAVVDSLLFLWIAFGSLNHLTGQVVGKLWMVGVAWPVVAAVRRARRSRAQAVGRSAPAW